MLHPPVPLVVHRVAAQLLIPTHRWKKVQPITAGNTKFNAFDGAGRHAAIAQVAALLNSESKFQPIAVPPSANYAIIMTNVIVILTGIMQPIALKRPIQNPNSAICQESVVKNVGCRETFALSAANPRCGNPRHITTPWET